MDLNILWFILITVLFMGFFFLEGFDYGVGILLPFLGGNDTERRVIINTIGPVWDGNEVWLITAGGAAFAAFPNWYATLFSGFYLALFIILTGLIVRGVAFEFRSSDRNPVWRNLWDAMICAGSFISALLWGVALTNLLQGVPINDRMQYVGTFFDLLSPYTLAGGLTTLLVFTLHGALFISLKTEGELAQRAGSLAGKLGVLALPVFLLLILLTYVHTDLFGKSGAAAVLLGAAGCLALTWLLLRSGKNGWAFAVNGLTIVLFTVSIFWGLFPRVMVSSLRPEWSLTIYNASSSPYTLQVMTAVALVMVPVVLLYQGWTYWVFRRRVTVKDLHY
ncbi:cytochrome d ubiquinol oxidase subunit II [Desulforamulus hydrothermalis]|uniref:Cytochrome d ubiquinol oxidase subunit 2 n=1 Tax=Desulforamulus hydrothermalis Lam5 = DSM 18033 TaxID=1121428 RepID=K8DXI8_9FIRM|nr:cytochrome d ubiquinol oxidase subunit II [Desulforamulus hydrothermalis]CCO07255.1 Cytochrome d ubiquinol oxidase subunit 2 [Desulforamulus hydrothermalis Lam5 = DSM 18033]SHG92414.1 cytochrome bd-I ubiquinol oxidase subunit 2 apoprotein [Desulforamulus hydrothermalis Lam5 = DSM 18033]